MLDKILDQAIQDITFREILSCSNALQRLVFRNLGEEGSALERTQEARLSSICTGIEQSYTALTPKLRCELNRSRETIALLDTGAEINVITRDLADEAGLIVRPDPQIVLVAYTGDRKRFDGICKNVLVSVSGIEVLQHIFVVDSGEHSLLLGQPFAYASSLTFEYGRGSQYTVIQDQASGRRVRARVSTGYGAGDQEAGLFPGNAYLPRI